MERRKSQIGFVSAFMVLTLTLSLTLFASPASSAIPSMINYQGYLTNASGVPLHQTVQMTFKIYSSLLAISPLWTETQEVKVSNGVYNVNLGHGTPVSLPFDSPYYLGITVGADPEMTPRVPLTSVGYAFRAQAADAVSGSGTFSNTIISTVTTGTPPLQVSSTTNVTNLSSDMLDGKHASDFGTAAQIANLQSQISALQTQVNSLTTLLSNFTRVGNDIYMTGANLHIRSGSGVTNGTVNGLGNLIIGYNELRGTGDNRTGSHNLVLGLTNNYSSYGGMIGGSQNTISAGYATILGGYNNTASGLWSSVSGGAYNTVSGSYSSVSGGENNTASGNYSSVSGGRYNVASGRWSHVSGGGSDTASEGNEAYSEYSSILGGIYNRTGDWPSGGRTVGLQATIAGGYLNAALGNQSTVSGGYTNDATGAFSSVAGGRSNTAGGGYAFIGGGYFNTASGDYSSIGGGHYNAASGTYSLVGGGYSNTASGSSSTISGGYDNTITTQYGTVSGARPQYDSGWVAIPAGDCITLTHNLGGNVDNYVVDLWQYDTDGNLGRNHRGYGGDLDTYDNRLGALWDQLSASSIRVCRLTDDAYSDLGRVRIWVNN